MSHKAASCPVTVYCRLLGGGVSLVLAGLQAHLCLSTIHTAGPSVWALVSSLCLNPSVWGSHILVPPSPGPFCVGILCPYTPFPQTLLCGALVSLPPFTIGSAFPGVWNKRSPLTSVPTESLRTSTANATSSQPMSTSWHWSEEGWEGQRYRGGGHWANKSCSTYLRSHHWGTEAGGPQVESGLHPQHLMKLGIVAHARSGCKEDRKFKASLSYLSMFEVSLGYVNPVSRREHRQGPGVSGH